MARQWRIEFPGAFYHVISRGNVGQDIFLRDRDRRLFLELLGKMSVRFRIEMHAYMLMDNQYHLLISLREKIFPEECSGSEPRIREDSICRTKGSAIFFRARQDVLMSL